MCTTHHRLKCDKSVSSQILPGLSHIALPAGLRECDMRRYCFEHQGSSDNQKLPAQSCPLHSFQAHRRRPCSGSAPATLLLALMASSAKGSTPSCAAPCATGACSAAPDATGGPNGSCNSSASPKGSAANKSGCHMSAGMTVQCLSREAALDSNGVCHPDPCQPCTPRANSRPLVLAADSMQPKMPCPHVVLVRWPTCLTYIKEVSATCKALGVFEWGFE